MRRQRRGTRGSDDHATGDHGDIRNGCRHEEHERFNLFVCVICIIIALLASQLASAADANNCMPHCWTKEARDVTFNDGLFLQTIDDEKECTEVCVNNETCIGVYWGFNPILKITSCWLQMPFRVVSESLTNATHWSLSKCSDQCLPYCWKPKWVNIQTLGGVYQKGIDTENQCKVLCSADNACTGVDWNATEPSCWLLYMAHFDHKSIEDPIHHWELVRNLPLRCENARKPKIVKVYETIRRNDSALLALARVAPVVVDSSMYLPTANATCACPDYMTGIVTLAVLMANCVCAIIGLIAYILVKNRQEQEQNDNPYSRRTSGNQRYQSIRNAPDATEASETEATDKSI